MSWWIFDELLVSSVPSRASPAERPLAVVQLLQPSSIQVPLVQALSGISPWSPEG